MLHLHKECNRQVDFKINYFWKSKAVEVQKAIISKLMPGRNPYNKKEIQKNIVSTLIIVFFWSHHPHLVSYANPGYKYYYNITIF